MPYQMMSVAEPKGIDSFHSNVNIVLTTGWNDNRVTSVASIEIIMFYAFNSYFVFRQ